MAKIFLIRTQARVTLSRESSYGFVIKFTTGTFECDGDVHNHKTRPRAEVFHFCAAVSKR